MKKLKVIIPGEIVAYSHTGGDIEDVMCNKANIDELLLIKSKYEYLESVLDIEISEYSEDNIGDSEGVSEGADIGLRPY